jgi:aspartate aminotransferase
MLKHISDSYLLDAVQEYEQRRNVLVAGLRDIPDVEFQTPEGGFYVLAKLPVENSAYFARFVLQEFSLNDETVFVSPAHSFFFHSTQHTDYVRIAFVLSCDDLQKAAKIIKKALEAYRYRT